MDEFSFNLLNYEVQIFKPELQLIFTFTFLPGKTLLWGLIFVCLWMSLFPVKIKTCSCSSFLSVNHLFIYTLQTCSSAPVCLDSWILLKYSFNTKIHVWQRELGFILSGFRFHHFRNFFFLNVYFKIFKDKRSPTLNNTEHTLYSFTATRAKYSSKSDYENFMSIALYCLIGKCLCLCPQITLSAGFYWRT